MSKRSNRIPGVDPEAGWLSYVGRTDKSMLDSNGHVNFKHYYGLVARATDQVCEAVLYGGTAPEPLPMFFTLEARMRYMSELLAEHDIQIYVRPLERTDKTMRMLVQIVRTAPRPAVAAECEWTGAYIDAEIRRVRPMPTLARKIFDEKLAAAAEAWEAPTYSTGVELPDPPPEKRVLTSEGVILRDWIDRMGHVGIENYMWIFVWSNIGYLNAIGMDRKVMQENKWGKFVLSSHVRYLAELRQGDPYKIYTWMKWIGRKTACYRHELFRLRKDEGAPVLAATVENVMGIADLKARRLLPIPEFLIRGVERAHGVEVPEVESGSVVGGG